MNKYNLYQIVESIFTNLSFETFILVSCLVVLVLGVRTEKVYSHIKNRYVNYKNIFEITKVCIGILVIALVLLILNVYSKWASGLGLVEAMSYEIFWGSLISTPFIFSVKILIVLFTIVLFISFLSLYRNENLHSYEFPLIVLVITFALSVLVSANDFLMLFLALEMQGLALYLLCAIIQNKSSKVESALKYFIMGAVGSGFFLFGCGVIYLELATINLTEIHKLLLTMTEENNWKLSLGFCFIILAFLFKLGVAPFHTWLVDVYEGAPTTSVAYMAVVPKVAVFVAFIRVLSVFEAYDSVYIIGSKLLLILAIFSIIVGILGAFAQEKIRSFIAFSSVANMGYLLLVISLTEIQITTSFVVFMFLLIYGVTMITLLTIVVYLTNWSDNSRITYIYELSGLGKGKPVIAYIFSISLFSLIGVPPLAGFFSKFYLVYLLIESNNIFASLSLLLFGVLSVLYYLRIVKVLFFDKRNPLFIRPLPSSLIFIWLSLVLFQLFLWYNTDLILFISYHLLQI